MTLFYWNPVRIIALVLILTFVRNTSSWGADEYILRRVPLANYYYRPQLSYQNNYSEDTPHEQRCNCRHLKDCHIILGVLISSEKPLSSELVQELRRTSCGYDGNAVMVCCPRSDVRFRRDDRWKQTDSQESQWVWDVEPEHTGRQEDLSNIQYHKDDGDSNNWNFYNFHHMSRAHFYPENNSKRKNPKKHHYFHFEDPQTFKNCPPRISMEFEVPDHFRDVKPIKITHPMPIPASFTMDEVVAAVPMTTMTSIIVESEMETTEFLTVNTSTPESPISSGSKAELLNGPLCGLSIISRIMGGEDAGPGQFPWMARLAYRNRTSGMLSYRCAGSVISDRYVVTAAHCVTNLIDELELILVRLGELDATKENACDNGLASCSEPQDFQIESIIHHNGCDSPKYANDIALIRLLRPANSSFISALCLPIGQYVAADQDIVGSVGIIAGWGATTFGGISPSPTLKWVRLPVTDTDQCAASYARFSANSNIPIIVSSSQICVQGRDNADACQGDSGGPLMNVPKKNGVDRYTLLGLVSFGPRTCGVSNLPGVYTRLGPYMDWILSNISV